MRPESVRAQVQGAFRGRKVAAPLKHSLPTEQPHRDDVLPRPKGRGPIEALRPAPSAIAFLDLPRPKGRGPIEAGPKRAGPW